MLNNKKKLAISIAATLILASSVYAQSARSYISVVGSSTVYPFTAMAAEQFGKLNHRFKSPKVEATGTGGGFKLFCSGIGTQYPDIVNASRAIKPSELANCIKHGIKDIIEIKIGLDGVIVASSRKTPVMPLTVKELWLALAKEVPAPTTGQLIANPYQTWQDINHALPATKIEILGPPPTSGTRDAFVELVLDHGCKEFPAIIELAKADQKKAQSICQTIREDGAFIEAGENDNLIVNKLLSNPNALGIFGFNFLEENLDKIQGAPINGNQPTFENILAGTYQVARPLFVYVKKAHIGSIPGIQEFIAELTSEKATGEEGYLANKGLIPLPDMQRKQVADDANQLKTLAR